MHLEKSKEKRVIITVKDPKANKSKSMTVYGSDRKTVFNAIKELINSK